MIPINHFILIKKIFEFIMGVSRIISVVYIFSIGACLTINNHTMKN